MNKQQRKHFNELWKVKILKEIKNAEKDMHADGKVTRNLDRDTERTLKYIEYGFLEGIKYAQEGKRLVSKKAIRDYFDN